ncbi:hypothetical protein [Parerythrobacter lacustris]|uniref:Uncharacterized protein n=1 Tax=Parerythrobacter lacustris TaxID=2969984 RepID=A0ABT1XSA2_9SPHN|nr:hypothetical protein [Parerythrobacter lacustris]MCR2833836.1 hypothetical protein [Parerythrobacter lacustris]
MKAIAYLTMVLLPTASLAQDIDVKDDLEAKLRNKPSLTYGKFETVVRQKCHWVNLPSQHEFGSNMTEFCEPYSTTVDNSYQAPAKVVSTEILEIRDFKFHTERMTALPADIIIKKRNIFQCTEGDYSTTISEQLQSSEGWQFIKSRSVTTTNSIDVSATASYMPSGIGASAAVNVRHQTALTVGRQQMDSMSRTITRSVSDTYSFTGPKAVTVDVFAYRTTVEIPYSGVVYVDAVLEPNNSGIVRASQLLTLEERTFPIEGVLRANDVSNADFRAFERRGGCINPEIAGFVVDSLDDQYETAASLRPDFRSFGSNRSALLQADDNDKLFAGSSIDESVNAGAAPLASDQVIGPADGISYRVVFTRQEIRSDPTCGYTDLGLPKTRQYSIEQREYQQAQNGRIVRTWMESLTTMGQCLPGV